MGLLAAHPPGLLWPLTLGLRGPLSPLSDQTRNRDGEVVNRPGNSGGAGFKLGFSLVGVWGMPNTCQEPSPRTDGPLRSE